MKIAFTVFLALLLSVPVPAQAQARGPGVIGIGRQHPLKRCHDLEGSGVGTADRSEGAERVVGLIEQAGGHAEYVPSREAVADRIAQLARPGDRIVVMGARDDTLTEFARELFARLD